MNSAVENAIPPSTKRTPIVTATSATDRLASNSRAKEDRNEIRKTPIVVLR